MLRKELEITKNVLGSFLFLVGTATVAFLAGCGTSSNVADSAAGADTVSPDWIGGEIPPLRSIVDPYPSFTGMAVDPENDRVIMSDASRKSILIYDRTSGSKSNELTEPLRQIIGPNAAMEYPSGTSVDPANQEVYAINNDIADTMVVFSYDDEGNARPKRFLYVPHQAWGVSVSPSRDELAVSVESPNLVVVYRREAEGLEPPLRSIYGPNTGMADPHGISLDGTNNEIVVANHGNRNGRQNPHSGAYTSEERAELQKGGPREGDEADTSGHYQPPSLTVYPATAEGDVKPLRVIQGPHTQLDWPMEIDVDAVHDEIAVANNGDSSVLIFRRTDNGDVAPVRILRGNLTGIKNPMGVAIDTKNNELWVSNFGDHSAVVFDRTATGNVAPKRIIRNAPAGTPTCGFGNPMAAGYDTKRGVILVPN